MAMKFKNYPDFVKSELKAIPVGVAQTQMGVGAVLIRKRSSGFVRVGNLSGLCRPDLTDYNQIKSDLANVDTLQHPFESQATQETIEGFWSSKASGFLGVVVPNTGRFAGWMNSNAVLKYTACNITTHYLKDEYLLDIITNGKWKPNDATLKDLYIINEVVLTSRINMKLTQAGRGGVGALLDLPVVSGEAGLNYSVESDGSLNITGVVGANGERKPFAIAFRTAHVVYKDDFTLRRSMELGVRRGEHDGLHISGFVGKNEKYHIGEFFLNAVEDDDESDEEPDEENLEPSVVPIAFDAEANC